MSIIELADNICDSSKKYNKILSVCSTLLKYSSQAKEARNYLKTRIPTLNVAGFTFGYFPDDNNLNILIDEVGEDILKEVGLIYTKTIYIAGAPEYRLCGILSNHNIILPYKNLYGDIIGMVGRTLLSSEGQKLNKISKYKNTSLAKGMHLFGLYEAKKYILSQDSIIIVEGQFDCITCHRYGIKNVVALGGSAFTEYHLYLIKRYTNNIKLLLDNDMAGEKETENILRKYKYIANFTILKLDKKYKDIDNYINSGEDIRNIF